MRWIERLGASRWFPPLAALLAAPALDKGLVLDDYAVLGRLHTHDGVRWRGLQDAFAFFPAEHGVELREVGALPWWSEPGLRLSFFRPLAALTHALDSAALAPWAMHLESLLLLAALNVAVAAWYRRLLGESHGLATALFAVAPGHVFAASWLANRNAVLAALFAVLSLLALERARTWSAGALLALSLLSGEIGLGASALWLAFAICLARPRARALTLTVGGLVTLAWLALRSAQAHGAHASALYVDPLHDPLRFVGAALERLPVLVFGQLVLPGVALGSLLASRAAQWLTALALLVLALMAPRALALLRVDARARFAALGSLLALLPVVGTVVHDRLTIVADIAGMSLLAQWLMVRPNRLTTAWASVRAVGGALLGLGYAQSLQQHIELGERAFAEILREPEAAAQSAVFVNSPCAYYPIQLRSLRAHEGGPVPRNVRTLAPGIYPVELERINAITLRLRTRGGLLQPLGHYRASGRQPGWFSQVYLAQTLDHFARARWSFQPGDAVELSDLGLRVIAVTADGYPETLEVTLRAPPAHYRFFRYEARSYRPFTLPAIGKRVLLEPEHGE